MIIDPTNENHAIDETDGEVMGAVRVLSTRADAVPPTVAELNAAPIVGYARPDAFTHRAEEDQQ